MGSIITVENLSKRYVIGHQKQERYTTLRDVISHKIRGIVQRIRHPLSPNREKTILEEFWALDNINLEIKQNDRVGIIGRNGAGKSTLLKILSRITKPTTGRITIKGRVASLLEVGTGFHPELTGRENIFLNGAILGMNRVDIKKSFDEIVAFAEVEKFLDTPVKRYSSGMYVRLAFAVAAHLEPEILIVDEVLAVGDAQFQKKCIGKMNDTSQRDGRTVIFVSHSMTAISALCNKVLIMDKGKLVLDAPTQVAVEQYVNYGNTNQLSAVEWCIDKAPGDDVAKLLKVAVLNGKGVVSGSFERRESIHLQFEYIVLRKSFVPLVAQIQIMNQSGICVFMSIKPHEEKTEYGRCRYRCTCVIPAKLMKEGNFQLDIILTTPMREVHLHKKSVVSFKVNDSVLRAFYFGPIPGIVRPDLIWNTQIVSQGE
ncbi:MAG: ABC transporter ATP-binding protein [Desulfobacula sp.]|nr:ABC transporter ATP-binding protein [Desulfobacula sp.]